VILQPFNRITEKLVDLYQTIEASEGAMEYSISLRQARRYLIVAASREKSRQHLILHSINLNTEDYK
jgi:hypothetical protein